MTGQKDSGRRVTLAEVARAAGVGLATVDRLVNGRGGVRRQTAERVLDAARQLDFRGLAALERAVHGLARPVSLGLMIQPRRRPHYREIARSFESAALSFGAAVRRVEIAEYDALAPADLAGRLMDLGRRVDGVAAVLPDTPEIVAALDQLRLGGRAVALLLTPIRRAAGCVFLGVDSDRCGRMAAWLLSTLTDGDRRLAVLVGSRLYGSQDGRLNAFRAALGTPHDLPVLQYAEEDRRAAAAVRDLMARTPAPRGLYGLGAGVRGMVAALADLPAALRPRLVCHELTPAAREGLAAGLVQFVIDTPRETIAAAAVRVLVERCAGRRVRETYLFPPNLLCPASL